MKTKNLFLRPELIATLNLIPGGWVTAQTFTNLPAAMNPHTNFTTSPQQLFRLSQ